MTDLKCKDRINAHYEGRMEDIRKLAEDEFNQTEVYADELGSFNEYGLCFDYVEPYSFSDHRAGYYRWQLSTGGPGDEFRFYVDGEKTIREIEYWFLDWFDGACLPIEGKDFDLLVELWQWYIQEYEIN